MGMGLAIDVRSSRLKADGLWADVELPRGTILQFTLLAEDERASAPGRRRSLQGKMKTNTRRAAADKAELVGWRAARRPRRQSANRSAQMAKSPSPHVGRGASRSEGVGPSRTAGTASGKAIDGPH